MRQRTGIDLGALPRQRTVTFLDVAAMAAEVDQEIQARWHQVVSSGQFVGGAEVARFEEEWAGFCGVSHAVGVANGTDALHLALRALEVGPGDDVIVPANSFVATTEAVVLAGATPRFADVDPGTLLLTPHSIEAAMTPATRAVLVVHLYGQLPDMEAIEATASRLGIHLVEDAAQAHGATWRGRRAGSFGIMGCFSFYPGKNLGAYGDAGAVVTSDERLMLRLRSMRDHGRSLGQHYEHDLVGLNSRLDALQAVVLSAKLRRLESWNAARRQSVAAYRDLLDPERARLVEQLPGVSGAHHLAVVRVRDRDQVRAQLADAGIPTGVHYPTPCHRMRPYERFATAPLPNAESAAQQVLSLPLHPYMQAEEVDHVCHELHKVARKGVEP